MSQGIVARSKYRILVLIKGLNLGGAERLLVDALPFLDQGTFEYHFAYLLPWSNFLVPQFETAGFAVYCLDMPSNARLPRTLPALDRLHRQQSFDLIHAHLPMTGILARIVGRWRGIPVVYTEHNLLERCHPATLWATRLTYGLNDLVFAVSRGVYDSIARFGLEKVTRVETLLNGVPVEQVRAEVHDLDELRRELGIPGGHLVVGTVAVLTQQKLLTDWLEVARTVAQQRDDVTFLLVGGGPEEAALAARARALGLEDRVRMPGFRADGRRLMGLMDIYLMTSAYEGLPIALLEAMALGKPVVSTAVGGIPEAVEGGSQGFLAPVGSVETLARHTLRLLEDAALRSELGRQGAERVERDFHSRDRIRFVENRYLELLHATTA